MTSISRLEDILNHLDLIYLDTKNIHSIQEKQKKIIHAAGLFTEAETIIDNLLSKINDLSAINIEASDLDIHWLNDSLDIICRDPNIADFNAILKITSRLIAVQNSLPKTCQITDIQDEIEKFDI
jgi:pyrimidine operon attenuation protein/uracil phosphoribosyltransferase